MNTRLRYVWCVHNQHGVHPWGGGGLRDNEDISWGLHASFHQRYHALLRRRSLSVVEDAEGSSGAEVGSDRTPGHLRS
jgi:hypothetical protein